MVVKGDGSLIEAAVALNCPVETILSGPAASVVGARYLSRRERRLRLRHGRHDHRHRDAARRPAGAEQGRRHRRRLEAPWSRRWPSTPTASAATARCGSTSIRLRSSARAASCRSACSAISIPRCWRSCAQHAASDDLVPYRGQFALRQRPLDAGQASLNPSQIVIWSTARRGAGAAGRSDQQPGDRARLGRLVDRGLVLMSGFTPSDAAHVLGQQDGWNRRGGPDSAPRSSCAATARADWHAAGRCRRPRAARCVEQVVRQIRRGHPRRRHRRGRNRRSSGLGQARPAHDRPRARRRCRSRRR